jgi:ectoine hydroxylase-related dioxygenase (phytanoyl-CoA dioxygenase family)
MVETTDDRETEEEIGFMNIDETDFSCLTVGQQIRHLEVEGYAVLPDVLGAEQMERIKAQMAEAPMQTKDYSKAQTYHLEPQWYSTAVAELIANPKVTDFLKVLLGDDLVFTHGLFTHTLAGSPPISLHTDGQPFGSSLFGYEGSSPRLLRVLYYLDDLVPERAPFRVVPRSHLSFHAQANPYVRYKWHPGEITLCPKAGTAVVMPINMFHGTHPNKATSSRTLVQLGYRPAWAGPIQPMEEWDPDLVAAAPEETKPFLRSLNTTGLEWNQAHKPKGMKTEAPAIDPDRWER